MYFFLPKTKMLGLKSVFFSYIATLKIVPFARTARIAVAGLDGTPAQSKAIFAPRPSVSSLVSFTTSSFRGSKM